MINYPNYTLDQFGAIEVPKNADSGSKSKKEIQLQRFFTYFSHFDRNLIRQIFTHCGRKSKETFEMLVAESKNLDLREIESKMPFSAGILTDDIIRPRLATAVKNGKFVTCSKNVIGSIKNGEAKLVLFSSNCPDLTKEAVFAQNPERRVKMHTIQGNSQNLAAAVCLPKKLHVHVIAITDPADSDILSLFSK